jgi:hypothetical protein
VTSPHIAARRARRRRVAGWTGEAIALPALVFAAAALLVHRRRVGVLLIGAVPIAWEEPSRNVFS